MSTSSYQRYHTTRRRCPAPPTPGSASNGMWDNVAIRTGGHQTPAIALDFWTNVRHDIVHRGKKPTVHRHRARACLNLVAAIETEFDQVAVDLY